MTNVEKKMNFAPKKIAPFGGDFIWFQYYRFVLFPFIFGAPQAKILNIFEVKNEFRYHFLLFFCNFDQLEPAAGAGSRKSVFSNYKSPFDSSQSRYRPNKANIYNFPNIRIFPTFGFFSTFTKKFNIDCNCSVSTNVEKTSFFNI